MPSKLNYDRQKNERLSKRFDSFYLLLIIIIRRVLLVIVIVIAIKITYTIYYVNFIKKIQDKIGRISIVIT